MKKVDIVVAYYNEDLSWIDKIKSDSLGRIFIYNKSGDDRYIPLDNIGQDPHTYLTHIIENYDNLGDATIFLQGNPFTNGDDSTKPKSVDDIVEFINQLQEHDYTLNHKYQNYDYGLYNGKITYWGGEVGDSGYIFHDWILEKFNITDKYGFIYWGQQFGVSKNVIRRNTKEFYIDLRNGFKHKKDEMSHFIERMWFNVFKLQESIDIIVIVETTPQKIIYTPKVNGVISVDVFEKERKVFNNTFKVKENINYFTTWSSKWFDKKIVFSLNNYEKSVLVHGENIKYNINSFGDFYLTQNNTKRTSLCDLMDKFGSDKASNPKWSNTLPGHNYSRFYYSLFEKFKNNNINIFELGLGTNNPNLSSSMGEEGFPSASIMAWEQFFPNAKIFGADIDVDILVDTNRTKTFYCDQTKPKIIKQMWNHVDLLEPFDIIIEDGLHEFNANITFLENSIHKIKESGYFIIEDIMIDTLPMWFEYFNNNQKRYKNFKYNFISLICDHNYWDNNLIVLHRYE